MVYVEDGKTSWGKKFGLEFISHMMTDGDTAELVEFAKKIGLKSEWIQDDRPGGRPHYDLTAGKRGAAIRQGAQVVSIKEMIKLCPRKV
jgi:hypothetical protein